MTGYLRRCVLGPGRGTLKCPDCPESSDPMEPYTYEEADGIRSIVLDRCHLCKGIWFDHGEFGLFKRTLAEDRTSSWERGKSPESTLSVAISTCPRCDMVLHEIHYGYNSGVQLKSCKKCQGLWLPAAQIAPLINLVHRGQAIASDLYGLAKGLRELEHSRQTTQAMKRAGHELQRPVSPKRALLGRFIAILPLYDENPRRHVPIFTMALLFTNLFVFLYLAFSSEPHALTMETLAFKPVEIGELKNVTSLFTSLFAHGGLCHLAGNMFFLWTFGDNVEDTLGPGRFLLIYFLSGIIGALVQVYIDPQSTLPHLGASGAISGLLGAYLRLFPHTRIKTIVLGSVTDIPTWTIIGLWLGFQVFSAGLSVELSNTSIAWWAHVAGFATGLITTMFLLNKSHTSE